MYRITLICLLLWAPFNNAWADQTTTKQRFVVSLGAPLKAGDDALRMVMEICEIATIKDGNRVLVVVETRDEARLREYLWTRSRTALRIDHLPRFYDLRSISVLFGTNTASQS